MAEMIRCRKVSAVELMTAHLKRIDEINPSLNAVAARLDETALVAARAADQRLADGLPCGPLNGVPFSVKDSIDVAGVRTTAGTLGRSNALPAAKNATLVERFCQAGGIPIAKTNLPDLLFSFESDNLIFGRSNNPYDVTRTPGGSSGGEAALIAACGSPLGLGSDAAGSVRVPAAFCGIASIKPTSGRLPRTGHVPAAGGWLEALWQIGPMARFTEDLLLAMQLLAREDDADFTSPPAALLDPNDLGKTRIAFFVDNGFASCQPEVKAAVERCAHFFAELGMPVERWTPPGVADAYELELALLGADGADGIDEYLSAAGSHQRHPLLNGFLDHVRPHRMTTTQFAKRWQQWDEYRANLRAFFQRFDAILCPVYTQTALQHGESQLEENFRGFSYTMAWNVAGAPAATVRCGNYEGLPINVQIVTRPWRDMLALELCRTVERQFGGWKKP
jgi:amidase